MSDPTPTARDIETLEQLNAALEALFPVAGRLLTTYDVELTVMALLHLAGQIAYQAGLPRARMDYLYDTGMVGGRISVEQAREMERGAVQ